MADAGSVDAVAVDAITAVGAVLLLAAVTMATRVGGVWMMSYVRITPRIQIFLKYMSVSVLISIVVPAAWAGGPHIWPGVFAAAAVMAATRSAVGAMLAGTALAAVARSFGL
jgi:uncharacterized membrane protein